MPETLPPSPKEQRLAQKLRENLRRRKVQARELAQGAAPDLSKAKPDG